MLARLLTALLLLPAAVTAQDIVIAVHGSPGINPYTSFSYVDRYAFDLQFENTVRWYPLLTGSPRAAVIVQGLAFISEGRCVGYPNYVCSPHVVRYGADGNGQEVGPAFAETPLLRITSRGELLAVTSTEIVRIQPFTGDTLGDVTYSLPGGAFLQDADLSSTGCDVAISYFPKRLALGNLCSSSFVLSPPLSIPPVYGVRFMPDGTLLTSGPNGLSRIDRTGQLLRLYPVPADNCVLAIAPGARAAAVGCDAALSLVDLDTGTMIRNAQPRNGLTVQSIDFIQNIPARRRAAEH
jgi:hypothetical protein